MMDICRYRSFQYFHSPTSSVFHCFVASTCNIAYDVLVLLELSGLRGMFVSYLFCAAPLHVSPSLSLTSYIMYVILLIFTLRYTSLPAVTSFFHTCLTPVSSINIPLVMLRQQCLHVYNVRVSCCAYPLLCQYQFYSFYCTTWSTCYLATIITFVAVVYLPRFH